MGNDREALKGLSEERVAFPSEMAVTDEVWTALNKVHFHPIRTFDRKNLWCMKCLQAVALLMKDGKNYRYSEDELNGLKLAHMIQVHGWTRETPNAEQS